MGDDPRAALHRGQPRPQRPGALELVLPAVASRVSVVPRASTRECGYNDSWRGWVKVFAALLGLDLTQGDSEYKRTCDESYAQSALRLRPDEGGHGERRWSRVRQSSALGWLPETHRGA